MPLPAWPPCSSACVPIKRRCPSVARSQRPCPSASASASPRHSRPAAGHRPVSHVAPLPVVEAVVEPVRSLISPLPHLICKPLHHAVSCELHDQSSHSARRFQPQVTGVWSRRVASSHNPSSRQSPVPILTSPKPSSSAAIAMPRHCIRLQELQRACHPPR
jgi:hypothetical protein